MSIIRVVHNKENPFVQLNKKTLWDENLSLKAVGLWARCMSRPDNWRFNISELVKKCKEGRRAIDSAIHELISNNYAVRLDINEKDEHGKYSKRITEYVFFEFPATQEDRDKVLEEFKKFYRDCCFGNLRNGDLRNDELPIKSSKEKEREQESAKAHSPEQSETDCPRPRPQICYNFSIERFDNIETEDIESWKQLYPTVNIDRELIAMNEWIQGNLNKARNKKRWRTFINRWLSGNNERNINREAFKGKNFNEVDRRPKDRYGNVQPSQYAGIFQ